MKEKDETNLLVYVFIPLFFPFNYAFLYLSQRGTSKLTAHQSNWEINQFLFIEIYLPTFFISAKQSTKQRQISHTGIKVTYNPAYIIGKKQLHRTLNNLFLITYKLCIIQTIKNEMMVGSSEYIRHLSFCSSWL